MPNCNTYKKSYYIIIYFYTPILWVLVLEASIYADADSIFLYSYIIFLYSYIVINHYYIFILLYCDLIAFVTIVKLKFVITILELIVFVTGGWGVAFVIWELWIFLMLTPQTKYIKINIGKIYKK